MVLSSNRPNVDFSALISKVFPVKPSLSTTSLGIDGLIKKFTKVSQQAVSDAILIGTGGIQQEKATTNVIIRPNS
jgi:hypothetical protein